MKIQGSNPLFNAYSKQLQQQNTSKKQTNQSDRLDISKEALKLQDNEGIRDGKRAKMVEEIKERVQSGEYTIDYAKTASKMMKVWSNRLY